MSTNQYLEKIVTAAASRELSIWMAGRQTGKSLIHNIFQRIADDIRNQPVTEMVLSEARMNGARYYVAEPIGGNWIDMEAWIVQRMGSAGEVWARDDFTWPELPRWFKLDRRFWFRSEADRTLFVLKWR